MQNDTNMTDRPITLKESVPLNKHKLIGAADPQERFEMTIKLRRKTEGLPTLKEFVAGKRAVGITRQVLAERYGASQDDADAVHQWAVQQGLSVWRVDLGRRQMHLVGCADAMSQAFGVKLAMYKHSRTGVRFRCPKADIRIPKTLAPIITGVLGLNDMPVVRLGLRLTRKVTDVDRKQQFPGSFYSNEVAKLNNFPSTQGSGQRVAVHRHRVDRRLSERGILRLMALTVCRAQGGSRCP